MSNQKTKDDFLISAKEIHLDKYDYSNVFYIKSSQKVKIICYIHGEFLQTPHHHLSGAGCKKCGYLKVSDKKRLSIEEFLQKAKFKHSDKYDYCLVDYINNQSKIKIICKYHGEFIQCAGSHLKGYGCKKCSGLSKKDVYKFTDEANLIHENKYDYSNVIYKNTHIKVKISCKKHGCFEQRPSSHLMGMGCPVCNNKSSKLEIEFLNYLGIKKENRQITINGFNVDGYEPETRTIYEFLGDFWHGNPDVFNHIEINNCNKKTFKELYNNTFDRIKKLKSFGYNIKYIWENDWINFKNHTTKEPKIFDIIS